MRRKILSLLLGSTLAIAAVAPASAATCTAGGSGAAGLVAAVVNANVCDVYVLNNSLNNLLRNADIHVLENILNNSPILSYNDVDISRVVSDNQIAISILGGPVLLFQ